MHLWPWLVVVLGACGPLIPGDDSNAEGEGSDSGSSTSGGSSPTATSLTTSTPTTTSTTGTPGTGACCTAHPEAGCEVAAVSTCVCASAPWCCDPANGWTDECVKSVDAYGCGVCGTADTSTVSTTAPDTGVVDTGPIQECLFAPDDPECTVCLKIECCDTYQQCYDHPACACLSDCVLIGSPADVCVEACEAIDVLSFALDLQSCLQEFCNDECPL